MTLDTDVTLVDPELDALNGGNGNYSGGSLQVQRQGGANTDDVFTLPGTTTNLTIAGGNITNTGTGHLIGTFTNTGGTLSVTWSDAAGTIPTTALVSEFLQAIQYQNTVDSGTHQINFTLNDGAANGVGSINATVNLAPAFSGLDNTPTFNQGGSAVTLDGNGAPVSVTGDLMLNSGRLEDSTSTLAIGNRAYRLRLSD